MRQSIPLEIRDAHGGEQPLGADSACNLGHLVLSQFITGNWARNQAKIDWESLEKATRLGIRFQDNMIDYGYFPTEATKLQQQKERRVGMGTMGLGTLLIMLGIKYGSKECEEFLDILYSNIAYWAYDESMNLAQEKGSFPVYNYEKHIQSGFMKRLLNKFSDLNTKLKNTGIRNVTTITQAPTGSTGTLIDQIPGLNCSTGIEPYYSFEYYRAGRLGTYKQEVELVKQYRELNNLFENNSLPDYFVTAMDLKPEDHIKVQATIQKWVDSSISKTANAPESYTIKDTNKLYMLAYDLGCKGVTIYRENSREAQVLSDKEDGAKLELHIEVDKYLDNKIKENEKKDLLLEPEKNKTGVTFIKRAQRLYGFTEKVKVPTNSGNTKVYVTINLDEKSNLPKEVFILANDTNLKPTAEALGRMVTQFLRFGCTESNVEQTIKHLKQGQPIGTLPWHIGRLLEDIIYGKTKFTKEESNLSNSTPKLYKCSECGNETYDKTNCICTSCGSSKCN